jgi:hypothetical protein
MILGEDMKIKRLLTISLVSMLCSATLIAQEHTPKHSEKNIVQKLQISKQIQKSATDILMNSYHYIESLKHFQIIATVLNEDVYQDDIIMQWTHHVLIDVKRPSKMFIDISGDVKNQKIYLENGLFTIYSKKYNMYGQLKVKNSIDETLDMLFEKYDIKAPLANLIYSDISKRLKPKNEGYIFGEVTYNGVKCDYIGFSNKYREIQVWIQKGDKPLIRKFVIIDKTTKQHLRSTTMLKWNLHPFSFFDMYKFTAPKGAVKIDILPYEKD